MMTAFITVLTGIADDFVKEVQALMKPGPSAIFRPGRRGGHGL